MKTTYSLLLLALYSILSLSSCNNDDDGEDFDNKLAPGEINSFIFRGLNEFYLFKNVVPELTEGNFSSNEERDTFIRNGGDPSAFFESLTIAADRFSFIIDDFERLERLFQGIRIDDGLDFNEKILETTNQRYIVITDVIEGSPADRANITRGMIFNRINGAPLNVNNRIGLFNGTSVTLGQAQFEGNTLVDLENEISLTREEITENPIATTNVINEDGHTIGYLQYNGFVFNFEEQLNEEFAKFRAAGVTDFVLDLRYNGGGRTITSNALAGMITGQFGGQVFSRRRWNEQIQTRLENEDPESLTVNFVTTTTENEIPLNSLNLNKLYVLTTKQGTASASELIVNSLKPYIDVVVVGDPTGTVGKPQASITLHDSPNFSRNNVNPAHKYAMQPLVFSNVNANDESVAFSGLVPDIEGVENDRNLGVLGDPNEPLLRLAIDDITGKNTPSAKKLSTVKTTYVGSKHMYEVNFQRMYDAL